MGVDGVIEESTKLGDAITSRVLAKNHVYINYGLENPSLALPGSKTVICLDWRAVDLRSNPLQCSSPMHHT